MTGTCEALGKLLILLFLLLLIPLLVAVAVQTVQNSRVVTMLLILSLIIPILPQLGLPPEISLPSMVCGIFLFSHVNDPFFWIFRDLAEMDSWEALREYAFRGILREFAGLPLLGCGYLIAF
ncbi:hypothetical protein [uncultured Methanomethylovorans sp.]|uniref:GntT/GntP/DsdX family permease n=1 Tax=uncultured Methanomethylovorans sp. TaxID=183759 RepID=UPI002AA5FAC0|nr:hypothetical protein [uncultured Methanomethylovorans sp.]